MTTIETLGGNHIRDVLADAVETAAREEEVADFEFNGMHFVVEAGEEYEAAKARWEKVTGIPVLSREEEVARLKADREEREAVYEKARADAGVPTEQEMREADVPWPETMEELSAYIEGLTDRPHDYGTCVYAMSMAATAAFQHVAKRLGVTGFQASCADMDILRRTRCMEDGFRIVNYHELLYPQYWDAERTPIFEAALRENCERWLAKVQEKMRESGSECATTVWHHWQDLAKRCNETIAARAPSPTEGSDR